MPITLTVTAKVRVPTVPNFLLEESGDQKFPLSAFPEDELRRIAAAWTEALITRSKEQKNG